MSSSLPRQTNAIPALSNTEGKAWIDGWLNYRLRITIADSRAFEGRFKCVDRDCNIVLAGTEEFKDSTPPLFILFLLFALGRFWTSLLTRGVEQRRFLGLIVIPGVHIKTVELIQNSHFNI